MPFPLIQIKQIESNQRKEYHLSVVKWQTFAT